MPHVLNPGKFDSLPANYHYIAIYILIHGVTQLENDYTKAVYALPFGGA